MSGHHHEREEKICLNCGAELHGHYCHVCGQENNEPRENAWHIIRHFFEDITHFDGKFFDSLKYVITRPGFLAKEYTKGRRVSYLNPIRMYLFYSAFFFLITFSLLIKHKHTSPEVARYRDSIEQHNDGKRLGYNKTSVPGTDETAEYLSLGKVYPRDGGRVFDSIQRTLPDTSARKVKGAKYVFYRNLAKLSTAYHKDPNKFMEQLNEQFTHSLSKIFFISLPLFTLLLWLMYLRRKEQYFVAHAVFTIHFYCMVFVFGLLLQLINQIEVESDAMVTVLQGFGLAVFLGMYVYLYVAMYRFYNQGWFKTAVKWLIQSIFFTAVLIVVTVLMYIKAMSNLG